MTTEPPPLSQALMPDSKKPITQVTLHDVLLGKGPGISNLQGNLAFRKLCDERKHRYKSTKLRKEKKLIAQEIRNEIHSRGGRFLKQDDEIDYVGSLVQEGFFLADDDVVLEKCKQSLRENKYSAVAETDSRNGGRGSGERGDESPELIAASSSTVIREVPTTRDRVLRKKAPDSSDNQSLRSESAQLFVNKNSSAFGAHRFETLGNQVHPVVSMSMAALPQFSAGGIMPSYADPRLTHFQTAFPFAFQQSLALKIAQSSLVGGIQGLPSPTSIGCLNQASHTLGTNPSRAQGQQQSPTNKRCLIQRDGTVQSSDDMYDTTHRQDSASSTDQDDSDESISVQEEGIPAMVALPDEKVSESFLTMLDIDSRQPRFTHDEEIREKESLTDREKAAALCDMFGKMCTVAPRQAKRSRSDLDDESIQFLIKQMRLELEKIPSTKKYALVEAHAKAQSRTEEFSDCRLERFLRCEGLNTELAAQRFVNYWKCRRELFGNDKYLMRMSLGEALADDLEAIEDGVFASLPQRDVSGRQLIYVEPNRRTEGRYSSESLLRAIWYTMEVTSQENNDISSGFVFVICHQHTTIWNYDRKALDRFQFYEKSCLPVQCVSWHVCCPTSVITKILKPITFALTDRRARSRTVIHDVSEDEILSILVEYGISKEMLPTEMGGNERIDMPKWMANRRAVELEEI